MALPGYLTPHTRNRLLGALSREDLTELWPQLEPVELEFRKTLQRPDEPTESVYFPEVGYLSQLSPMEDGDRAEVGLIGPEGMTGLAVLLGTDRDNFELLVQVPSTAMRMDATAFRKALDDIPSLRPLLSRYAMAYFEQVARIGACNGRHNVDQRLARWLLMAHDRIGSNELPMTHEFLSMMLGVRRAGVTVAAGQLQKAGHIQYRNGHIKITDRPGLESVACECYGIVRRSHDSLFGLSQVAREVYRP